MNSAVLALNLGSSSLKFALFAAEAALPVLGRGERRWSEGAPPDLPALFDDVLAEVETRLGGAALIGAGHRVVHGGGVFRAPVRVDESVLSRLEAFTHLAPLHQPFNLGGVRTLASRRPGLPQVACFDTAFHATVPQTATRFGLPRRFEAQGVRRYGFHGLSYQHIAERMAGLDPKAAGGRVIAAHLGAGASLCAIKAGRSLDTTMGFSTLDGLVMSTRCGALDPGALLHVMQAEGLDAEAMSRILHAQSGLLGLSQISGDLRVLLGHPAPEAREAVDLYLYRAVREAGAMAAVLGGLDALVFTGGVGENAGEIRAGLCEGLAWLGVRLDDAANHGAGERRIDAAGGGPTVWVIPADEERVVAQGMLGYV